MDFHIGEFGFLCTLRVLFSLFFCMIFVLLLVNRANTYLLNDNSDNIII